MYARICTVHTYTFISQRILIRENETIEDERILFL